MTENHKQKTRAVFMAALMVLSVVAMTAAFPGAVAASNIADDEEALSSNNNYWSGQKLVIEDGDWSDETLELEEVNDAGEDDTTFITEFTTNDTGFANVPTDEGAGDYVISDGQGNWLEFDDGQVIGDPATTSVSDAEFTLREHRFNVTLETSPVTDRMEEVEFNVDSNRANFNATVDADGDLDEDELYDIFGEEQDAMISDDDEIEIAISTSDDIVGNFSGVSPANYSFTFDVTDTGAEDTVDVHVQDAGDVSADFVDSASVIQGDEGDIHIALQNTDNAEIQIGGEDDGWVLNATITDEDDVGEFNVTFSEFYAGDSSDTGTDANVLFSDDDDIEVDVTDHQNLNNPPLDTGNYDLELRIGNDRQDRSSIVIQERSTGDATVYTAPGDEDPDDADDLLEIISQSDEIAEGDLVVVEFEANGLYGYFDDLSANGVNVTAEQLNPARNTEAIEFTLDESQLHADAANERFFAVNETGEDLSISDGDEFEFTLEINGDHNPYVDEDETETASATFEVNERTLEFDNEMYEVENAEGQEITGTANFADGSEVDVDAEASGADGFFMTETAEVEDGVWVAEFDFSDEVVGTEFELTVEDPESDEDDDAEGIIVDSLDEPEPAEVTLNADAPSSVEQGDAAELTVTLENVGDEDSENFDYTVTVDGEEVDSDVKALEGGEEWDASYDLPTDAVGDVDWSVVIDGDDADDSAEGTLTVSEVPDDDDDDAPPTDDDDDDDDTVEPDDDDDDDEDDDGQPGFGVAVAIVALLGAAMLALRKQE